MNNIGNIRAIWHLLPIWTILSGLYLNIKIHFIILGFYFNYVFLSSFRKKEQTVREQFDYFFNNVNSYKNTMKK